MKNTNQARIYGAGIHDSNFDWVWQGTVAAKNMTEARKLLVAFKKEKGLKGTCDVTDFDIPDNFSKRKPGVYYSMVLE